MRHEFRLNYEPKKTTAQQKGVCFSGGKIHFYKKHKFRVVEKEIMWRLKPFQPKEPMDGPLFVKLLWCFPHLKATKNKTLDIWHDKRPDLDNLEKGFIDCMQKLNFFRDDGQIAWKVTQKVYGSKTGVEVVIETLTNGEIK